MKLPNYPTGYHWNRAIDSIGEKAIYLDIDGVLLDKHLKPVPCLHEFIEYVVNNYVCFWLTSHCNGLDTVEHMWTYLHNNGVEDRTLELMEKIVVTKWDFIKTEAIHFNSDFLWFEDMPSEQELLVLKEYGAEHRLVWVDREKGDGLCKWLNSVKEAKETL